MMKLTKDIALPENDDGKSVAISIPNISTA